MLSAVRILIAATAILVLASGIASAQDERPAHDPAGHGEAEPGMHWEQGLAEMATEEEMPPMRQQSFLIWFVGALGWKYVLLLPLSALFSLILTGVLVVAGKGKTTGAAVGFAVAIPFLIGIFGMIEGMMSSCMVIAYSTTMVKPSEVVQGFSTGLVTPLVGMLLMAPSYLLATVGLSIRALKGDPKP